MTLEAKAAKQALVGDDEARKQSRRQIQKCAPRQERQGHKLAKFSTARLLSLVRRVPPGPERRGGAYDAGTFSASRSSRDRSA